MLLLFLSLNDGEKERADFLSLSLLGAFVRGDQEDAVWEAPKQTEDAWYLSQRAELLQKDKAEVGKWRSRFLLSSPQQFSLSLWFQC